MLKKYLFIHWACNWNYMRKLNDRTNYDLLLSVLTKAEKMKFLFLVVEDYLGLLFIGYNKQENINNNRNSIQIITVYFNWSKSRTWLYYNDMNKEISISENIKSIKEHTQYYI